LPGIARVSDRTFGICYGHKSPILVGGTIVSGDSTDKANDLTVSRIGSTVIADCGHSAMVVTGSPTTFTSGIQVGRLGDSVSGIYVATIVTASPDVIAD
jgi:uncharacterized Zn-binding protein involved in type VI secretion